MADWDQQIIDQILASAGSNPDQLARTGDAHFNQAQFQEALFYYLVISRQQPEVAEHQYRMGLACSRLGQDDAAIFSFEQAIRLKPDYADAHNELSQIHLKANKVAEALHHARQAADLDPEDSELTVGLAFVLNADRQTEEATALVDQLLREKRETASLALMYSALAPRRKAQAEALALILRMLLKENPPREQSSLHFAAAQMLDSTGRYDEAFDHASQANRLRGGKYLPKETERQVRDWVHYFTPDTLRRLPRATHGSRTPVFIVGMPRSGTTLVEQILASHPAVHGAGELNWIEGLWQSALQRIGGTVSGLTQCLDRLTVKDADELAAEYLNRLQALSPGSLRITDKMPLNFMHLGLIAILFPQATIIHCRRNPMDTCLSCFMTDFNSFSYGSLPAYGHFQRHSELMMAHWKSVLDLPILDVDYEKMVGDSEAESRRLIDFVGLPWDDRCLRFHENKRLVATASQSQVRRPIYRDSIERWRHYEKHLGPLRDALGGGPVQDGRV